MYRSSRPTETSSGLAFLGWRCRVDGQGFGPVPDQPDARFGDMQGSGELLALVLAYGHQRGGGTQQRRDQLPLQGPQRLSQTGRVPAGVKGQDRRDTRAPRRGKRGRGDQRVDPLDVNDVVVVVSPHQVSGQTRREVVVPGTGVGPEAPDSVAGHDLVGRQLPGGVGRQDGHVHTGGGQSAGNLVDVGLDAAHQRQGPGGHHRDAKWGLGARIAHREPPANRPRSPETTPTT